MSMKAAVAAPKIQSLSPAEVVKQLDRFIIGQTDAKRAVAVAFRSRWRRQQLPEELREEVSPKNILMVGPTGVGKTEIARRLAKLCVAPFIKVEATKFTEVGFHGRDVDQIIKDLVAVGIADTKRNLREADSAERMKYLEERLLEALIGKTSEHCRDYFAKQLASGALDDTTVCIEVKPDLPKPKTQQRLIIQTVQTVQTPKKQFKNMTVKNAKEWLKKEDSEHIPSESIAAMAIKAVEENGIVFLDEIDKICSKRNSVTSSMASSEGVQSDLLPLIEGTSVKTKHGDVDTSKILFIASGAFYSTKPKDLLPELQGRLPVRVFLDGLSETDMRRIITEPECNLLVQQQELLKTDGINLTFTEEAITEIANSAVELNKTVENIGARRLYNIIEKVTEQVSYDCEPGNVVVGVEEVKTAVQPLFEKHDLSRYLI